MRKKMTVRVTKKDIKYGRQEDTQSCAIALALKDKGFTKVNVNGDTVCVAKKGKVGVYNVPARANTFIDNFDYDKKAVKPRTFKFDLITKFGWGDRDEFGELKRDEYEFYE